MTLKQSITTLLVAAACFGGGALIHGEQQKQVLRGDTSAPDAGLFTKTSYNTNASSGPVVDFEKAATKAAPAVVHIRTVMKAKQVSGDLDADNDLLRQFFDRGFGGNGRPQMQMP